MDDQVIDLAEYVRRREEAADPERTTFAVWGGDGEGARFALPLWRAAYLVSMMRAALAWERSGEAPELLEPAVVLDLGQEPARLEVRGQVVAELRTVAEPPAFCMGPGGGAVFLGERAGRRWYVVLTHPNEDDSEAPPESREDLFFVAGECAGLLFHRGLDEEVASAE